MPRGTARIGDDRATRLGSVRHRPEFSGPVFPVSLNPCPSAKTPFFRSRPSRFAFLWRSRRASPLHWLCSALSHGPLCASRRPTSFARLLKIPRVWVGSLELRKSHGKDLLHIHAPVAVFLDQDELL